MTRAELQHLMWSAAGVERSGETLAAAAEVLARARVADDSSCGANARSALETANLLDVARLVVTAALARRESRGAHFRSDFPAPSAQFARSLSWAREVHHHAH